MPNTKGAKNLERLPKWAMCMVCGDMLYCGPSAFSIEGQPIPRECQCSATRVVPTLERGYVQWDEEKYIAAAREAATTAARKSIRRIAERAYDNAAVKGIYSDEELKEIFVEARQKAEQEMAAKIEEEVANAPTEPEIEYAEPGEQLQASVPTPAPPTTLADIYKRHWQNIEKGVEP